jgi:hypothetical protein
MYKTSKNQASSFEIITIFIDWIQVNPRFKGSSEGNESINQELERYHLNYPAMPQGIRKSGNEELDKTYYKWNQYMKLE